MRRLPRPAPKPRGENTIALINIVFLMLIFFLIAGTLAPPMEGDVELIRAADARSVEPPRALFVTEKGVLKYEGQETTPEAYLEKKRSEGTGAAQSVTTVEADAPVSPEVKLAADGRLPATELIAVIDRLKTAGAGKIAVITERKAK